MLNLNSKALIQSGALVLVLFFIYFTLLSYQQRDVVIFSNSESEDGSTTTTQTVTTTTTTASSTTTTTTTIRTNTTTTIPSTTTTIDTTTPSYVRSPPHQPISPARLRQLLSQVRPLPGRVNNSIVYGLKDMFGTDLPIVNDVYNYNILITPRNNSECVNTAPKKLLIVTVVFMGADYFDRRQLIRNTWATKSNDPYDFKTVFVIGLSRNSEFNQRIKNESMVYDDLVQFNYTDNYYNLTTKLMCSLRWANEHCPNAQFILRINDDTIPYPKSLIKHLKGLRDEIGPNKIEDMIIGNLRSGLSPIRGNDPFWGKFSVTGDEYSEGTYFPFMQGSAYIVTQDVGKRFQELAKKLYWPPYSIWMEDVYIGMLCLHLDVNHVNIASRYIHSDCLKQDVNKCPKNEIVFMYLDGVSEIPKAWLLFKD